jgi:type VI secretion system secreted protein Hcp
VHNLFCVLMGLLGFKAIPAHAVDIFLCAPESPELEGESTDAVYKDCMDVLAWSWGMSNSVFQGEPGQVSVQDISATKYVDKASPKLMLATAAGTAFPKLELLMRDDCPDACKDPFYRLTMENVFVSSVSLGSSSGETRPTENVSFNFTKVEWCYTPVLADGSPGTEECYGWDLAKNVPF